MQLTRLAILAILSVMLLGCTSDEERLVKELESFHSHTATQLKQLKTHIKAGRIRNATLLTSYAEVLGNQKPELKPITRELAKDATVKGPMYLSLEARLDDARSQIAFAAKDSATASVLIDELNAINTGVSSKNFNLALTDPINVLAGMSDGKLARVKGASATSNRKYDQRAGNQLVGNPHYGHWKTNSSGTSFWAWYGQYAFFSSMFSQPVRYSHWSRHRPSSFYNDYGYSTYSSPTQKRQYQATEQKVRKKFASEGKKFKSPYASNTTANTKNSKMSAPGKFQSAYTKKSSHNTNTYSNTNTNSNTNSNTKHQSTYAKKSNNNSTYNSRANSNSGSRSYGSGGK